MAVDFHEEWEAPDYATIAELAPKIIYRLPGCDDTMVRFTLQESYVEFCRHSNALVSTREITLEHGEEYYPLSNVIPGCRVECVRRVFDRRRPLREGFDYRVVAGVPPVLDVSAHLLPWKEGDERALAVECLEIPNSGSERAPRWFIRKYGDAICAGALVRLFSMTGKAWSDAAQARIELGRWEGYIAAARLGDMSGSQFGNGRFDPVDTSELL